METTNKENRRKEREKNYIDMMSMVKNNFIKLYLYKKQETI